MRDVPVDAALPHLRALFPSVGAPEFVGDAITAATGIRVDPAQAEVRFVRYRPSRNCVVLWSFPTGREGTLYVSGRLSHDDYGARVLRRPAFRRLAGQVTYNGAAVLTPYAYLAEQRLLLQVYPLDVRLPGLIAAGREDWVRDVVSPAVGVPGADVARARMLDGSFKPWGRAVLEYVLHDGYGEHRYFGKLYRDDRGKRLLRMLRTIHHQLEVAGAPWNVPAPAAYIAKARMLLFQGIDSGVELTAEAGVDHGAELMTCLAAGLPDFQRTRAEGLPEMPPRAVVQKLRKSMSGLECADATFARLVERSLGQLDEEAAQLAPEPMVTAHGALRYDQLVVSDGGLTVLDLDTVCRSGASADAGNVIGCLDVTALRRDRLRSTASRWAEAFTQEIARAETFSPHWVEWHRRATRVKKSLRALFSLDPCWRDTGERLLGQAPERISTR